MIPLLSVCLGPTGGSAYLNLQFLHRQGYPRTEAFTGPLRRAPQNSPLGHEEQKKQWASSNEPST